MRFTFFKKIILIAALGCFLFSCSSDLDFEQAKEFNVQPVVTTNLAYIKADASKFILSGAESPLLSYTSNVDFLNSSFVEEDLVKTELYFRIKNTISRPFMFNVSFLDVDGKPIYNLRMDIPAAAVTEVIVEKTETFSATNVEILKNTAQMSFSILMLNGDPITDATPGRIELSSSITAYFDIQ
ncbi:hypothetical protein [Flavobacterium aestuarii]|uniref:hypothetical protein n=1 Tax=Flavobacterium aestuarii TaxID=3149227 RepID=UPI0032B59F04